MGKVIVILAIIGAFVAGTIMAGTAVDAAQGDNQGKPFQELVQNTFAVDSFFDVFYEIDLGSSQCPAGEIPKINSDFSGVECSSDFQVDSFFDVFYQIERDTQTNTDNVGQIQTELVALDLRGQSCNVGDVVIGIGADGQIICAPDQLGGLGDIQSKIDDKNAQIADLESQIAQKESDIATLQSQLDDLELTPAEQQACVTNCVAAGGSFSQCIAQCTYSDQTAADAIIQDIADLQAQLDALNQQLEDCQFELIVLQVLANINDPCEGGTASGTGNLPEECPEPPVDIDLG